MNSARATIKRPKTAPPIIHNYLILLVLFLISGGGIAAIGFQLYTAG
jgi:hypothetical protein